MTDLDLDAIEARLATITQRVYVDDDGCISEPIGEWADGDDRLPNHHNSWHQVWPGDVPALVALVRAKESWIDGAKVDMAAMEESLCGFSEEWHSRIIAERNEARAEAQKATAWHMEALDDLAACVAERDDARAEAERLMQEVERLHNAVRDIDAAYLVARAQDRADGGYRDGYCDGLEHAERIMRGN